MTAEFAVELAGCLFSRVYIGESLNIDPRQFYVQLYGAILQLDTGIYSIV